MRKTRQTRILVPGRLVGNTPIGYMDRIPGAQTFDRGLDRLGLSAGLLAPVAWGFTGVFVRLLHGVPTLAIVAGRLFIAVLVLIPWVLLRGRDFIGACRSPLSAAMGAYYILATEAFARAPVVEVTLVIGSAPVIAVGLERLRGVRPVRQQVIGAIVAVVGLVLFLRPRAGVGADRMFGYLFASGAAGASAAYAVALRGRALSNRPVNALALTVAACALGAVASFVLLGREIPASLLAIKAPTKVIYLVLLGVVSTAVPTLAFGVASLRLPPVLTTSFGLMTPLFAALFAGWFLTEWPLPSAIPGALLAITGLGLVLRAPPRASLRS
jgi:drug/metabolite transporter, DME family